MRLYRALRLGLLLTALTTCAPSLFAIAINLPPSYRLLPNSALGGYDFEVTALSWQDASLSSISQIDVQILLMGIPTVRQPIPAFRLSSGGVSSGYLNSPFSFFVDASELGPSGQFVFSFVDPVSPYIYDFPINPMVGGSPPPDAPEPGTLALLAGGLALVATLRRRWASGRSSD